MSDSVIHHNANYLREQVVGATICGVDVDDSDEDYAYACLQIRKPDGTELNLWIMSDAEGNGPGWLDVQSNDETEDDDDETDDDESEDDD